MPTDQNSYLQLLKSLEMPGAGIDIPTFRSNYLPTPPSPPPAAPPVITQGDPFGQSLATLGAGLAQPIQPNQSELGQTANAFLGGLNSLDASRAAQNAAAQQNFTNQNTTFNNQMDVNTQLGQQGQTEINAENANIQRGYYSGLLKQAGMGAYADAVDAGDERTLEWAKVAKDIVTTMITNMDHDLLREMDPSMGMGLLQDAMDMLPQNLNPSVIAENLVQKQAAAKERMRLAKLDMDWAKTLAQYPDLIGTKEDFYNLGPVEWFKKNAGEVQRLNQERAQKETESGPVGDALLNILPEWLGGLPQSETPPTTPAPAPTGPSHLPGAAPATRGATGSTPSGKSPAQELEELRQRLLSEPPGATRPAPPTGLPIPPPRTNRF